MNGAATPNKPPESIRDGFEILATPSSDVTVRAYDEATLYEEDCDAVSRPWFSWFVCPIRRDVLSRTQLIYRLRSV